eukprot:jgi/Ulvmu1/4151/UM019_0130.1
MCTEVTDAAAIYVGWPAVDVAAAADTGSAVAAEEVFTSHGTGSLRRQAAIAVTPIVHPSLWDSPQPPALCSPGPLLGPHGRGVV